MQNSLTLIRKPPKRDYIKMLENDHKILRYEAVMVSRQGRGTGAGNGGRGRGTAAWGGERGTGAILTRQPSW